ncbi:MAG: ribonuclease E/G [Clostridia bacterium]|nr:ribonuclease E/G [Clostridia bacterium]
MENEGTERLLVVDAAADVGGERVVLALIENGRVAEALAANERPGPQAGDVYVGRVQQAFKGMEAAFVDIGLAKHAFLPIQAGHPAPRPGQEVLVQIGKLPGGDKGVRVSEAVELAGALLALAPGGEGVGVSAKITDRRERERLKALGEALCPTGCALVLRTLAAGRSEEELAAACRALAAQWEGLREAARYARAPALLKAAPHPAERFALDLAAVGISRMVVSGDAWRERLAALFREAGVEASPIERYTGETSLRILYPIQKAMDAARRRKVWLPGGGTLVFDTCEAMTVIDVNTGKQKPKGSLEETALAVNLEAMREAAAQLRLRDTGGIVVIDAIGLREEEHRRRVLGELERALAPDRGRPRVYGGISELGLIQLTRKRLYVEPHDSQ